MDGIFSFHGKFVFHLTKTKLKVYIVKTIYSSVVGVPSVSLMDLGLSLCRFVYTSWSLDNKIEAAKKVIYFKPVIRIAFGIKGKTSRNGNYFLNTPCET